MSGSSTRKRIQNGALALFNAHGEANVSTNQLALELDISPGNLHYHFRRKQDLVQSLFDDYEKDMSGLLVESGEQVPDMEDLWFYLHLLFETMGRYRFLYRDINDLLVRYPDLRKPFVRLLDRQRDSALGLCTLLGDAGVLQADPLAMRTLVDHITMVMVYWLPFRQLGRADQHFDGEDLAQAVYQVISLVLPWLREPERSQARMLALSYLQ